MCLLLDSSIYLHGSGHALEAHFITALPLAFSAPFQHHFIESSLILPGTHSLPIHCPERPAKKMQIWWFSSQIWKLPVAAYHSSSQTVILGLAELESPGSLSEMWLLFRPTESDTLGIEPRTHFFNKPTRWFWFKSENHWPRGWNPNCF